MAGMNPGFAAYLAKKKAGGVAPKADVENAADAKMPGDKKEDASSMNKVAKRHAKVMTAPKSLKQGKYL